MVDQVQLEKMLSDVEIEKSNLKKERDQMNQNNQKLRSSVEEYRDKTNSLEKEKKRIITEAKTRAKELLDQANRRIESIIRGIKESGAEKETTKELRKDLDRYRRTVQPEEKATTKPRPSFNKMEIGDRVQVEGQETTGEVLQIFKNDAEILIGDLKSTVRLNRLLVIQKRPTSQKQKSIGKKYGLDLTQKAKSFSSDLDLRGKRAEEALAEVDHFLDDALLLGVSRIRIIHGKGYGILREVIRKHLDNSDYIQEIQDEEISQGGDGVSVILLK